MPLSSVEKLQKVTTHGTIRYVLMHCLLACKEVIGTWCKLRNDVECLCLAVSLSKYSNYLLDKAKSIKLVHESEYLVRQISFIIV